MQRIPMYTRAPDPGTHQSRPVAFADWKTNMHRRQFSALVGRLGIAAALAGLDAIPLRAQTATPISRDNVLRDPDIPPAGNPDGDVTIVEYFDYQCPYCKKVAPELARVVKEDGKIRVVLKDWPIFGELSIQAAKLVIAAKYQDRFYAAHMALMNASGKLTEARLLATLKDSGVDLERLRSDLDAHQKTIDALLTRNAVQARALGFQGTPSFIVGTFRVPGVPTAEQFKQMIADVRAGKDRR